MKVDKEESDATGIGNSSITGFNDQNKNTHQKNNRKANPITHPSTQFKRIPWPQWLQNLHESQLYPDAQQCNLNQIKRAIFSLDPGEGDLIGWLWRSS